MMVLQLNHAISIRVNQLLTQHHIAPYQLFVKSDVPKSTLSNIMNCIYDSVKLRIIHELCQGFGISMTEFYNSSLFAEDNLDP